MAKDIDGANAGRHEGEAGRSTKAHNVKHRNESIRDALDKTYNLDKEIERLTAQHIAPLREQKSKIKTNLRENFSITAKAFNVRYVSYKAERAAIEADDGPTLDSLKEMFEISPPGTQMDFLADQDEKPAQKPAAKKPAKKAAKKKAAKSS